MNFTATGDGHDGHMVAVLNAMGAGAGYVGKVVWVSDDDKEFQLLRSLISSQ